MTTLPFFAPRVDIDVGIDDTRERVGPINHGLERTGLCERPQKRESEKPGPPDGAERLVGEEMGANIPTTARSMSHMFLSPVRRCLMRRNSLAAATSRPSSSRVHTRADTVTMVMTYPTPPKAR